MVILSLKKLHNSSDKYPKLCFWPDCTIVFPIT